jgi:hypothetical protein
VEYSISSKLIYKKDGKTGILDYFMSSSLDYDQDILEI